MTTPIKYFGGQHYNAPWLVAAFPPRKDYDTFIDGCVGGGSVLLEHDGTDKSELINDVNPDLVNFWSTLANLERFESFLRIIQAIPFSQPRWEQAVSVMQVKEKTPPEEWPPFIQLKRAVDYFIVARQSMSGRHGRKILFTPTTTARLRSGMNAEVSAWIGAIDRLPIIHERLMRVKILNWPILKLVPKFAQRRVMMYFDPPWMLETRSREEEIYEHEMTHSDHEEFLKAVTKQNAAFIMISGRKSKLYEQYLGTWDTRTVMHALAAGKSNSQKQVEHTIWTNYDLPRLDT